MECPFSSTLTPVPIYTAWWTEAHVCKKLAQSCYVEPSGRDSNLWPLGCKSDALTTMPPAMRRFEATSKVKPGFLYPSWRPELTGDRFPLPVNTGSVDGPSTQLVETGLYDDWLIDLLTVLFSVHRGTGRAGAYSRLSAAGCRRDIASPASRICDSDSSEHRAVLTAQSQITCNNVKRHRLMLSCAILCSTNY